MRGWDRSCQKRLQLLVSPAGFTEPKETPHNGTRLSNRGDSAHYLLKNHSFYRPIVSGPVFLPTDHSLPSLPPGLENFTAWKEIGYNVSPRGENVTRGHKRVSRVQRRKTTMWKGPREILFARDGYLTSVCTRLKGHDPFSLATTSKLPSCLSILRHDSNSTMFPIH